MKSYQALEVELYEAKARAEQAEKRADGLSVEVIELMDKLAEARAEARFQKDRADKLDAGKTGKYTAAFEEMLPVDFSWMEVR